MKHGHVTGTKKERTGAGDWYREIEAENIHRMETEWQAKQEENLPARTAVAKMGVLSQTAQWYTPPLAAQAARPLRAKIE